MEFCSAPFPVEIGSCEGLVVVEEPLLSDVLGGRAFTSQPRLKLIDEGGNILSNDSTSIVSVSLYNNPSTGKLSPSENKIATVKNGIAQSKNLSIDKSGARYQLKYILHQKYNGKVVKTSIVTIGEFDNAIG